MGIMSRRRIAEKEKNIQARRIKPEEFEMPEVKPTPRPRLAVKPRRKEMIPASMLNIRDED